MQYYVGRWDYKGSQTTLVGKKEVKWLDIHCTQVKVKFIWWALEIRDDTLRWKESPKEASFAVILIVKSKLVRYGPEDEFEKMHFFSKWKC